jgi:hypothetical protein
VSNPLEKGNSVIFAVSAGNIGMALLALALLGVLAWIGFGCLKVGVETVRTGGILGVLGGLLLLLVGVAAAAGAVSGVMHIPDVLNRIDKTQGYQPMVLTVRNERSTIDGICIRYRPTWETSDCADRLQEQNRAVDVSHLQIGDKLYLDPNIGKKGNGDDRTEIYYHDQVITVSDRYSTLSKICMRWRPTWKTEYCAEWIRQYNRLPRLGHLDLGQRLQLPISID